MIEQEIEISLSELLTAETEGNDLLLTILKVSVDIKQNISNRSGQRSLGTTIQLLYRSSEPSPVQLDTLLDDLVKRNDVSWNVSDMVLVPSTFRAVANDSRVVFVENNTSNGRSSASKGLIAVTVILSIIVLLVSSVLLHITGGWHALGQAIMNCLFEEVEEDSEDNYLTHSKATFQAQSMAEDDEDPGPDDGESQFEVQTTMTNPSGMLGANARNLGIVAATPGHDLSQRYPYTPDDETQITMDSSNQLGITSVRKMPQDEDGGLAQMILRRIGKT